MGVEKARFRNPVVPDCKLLLKLKQLDHMVEYGNIKVKLSLRVKRWQMPFGQQLLVIEINSNKF